MVWFRGRAFKRKVRHIVQYICSDLRGSITSLPRNHDILRSSYISSLWLPTCAIQEAFPEDIFITLTSLRTSHGSRRIACLFARHQSLRPSLSQSVNHYLYHAYDKWLMYPAARLAQWISAGLPSVGVRWFKPRRQDQHSGSLNNWGESAALVKPYGWTLQYYRIRTINLRSFSQPLHIQILRDVTTTHCS